MNALYRTRPIALAALFSLLAASPVRAQSCSGDCNADRAVTVDEIVRVVNIALGLAPIDDCLAADTDGNGEASVDELVTMIDLALNGCLPQEVVPETWTPAFDATDFGWAMSGWGPGDGSLYVVGGGAFEGRIQHYRNGAWSRVEHGFNVPLFNWVHGTSARDVFVGGNDGIILHFDGNTWSKQTTPTTLPVWGLWAAAPNDVWAVGGDNLRNRPPLVMHYDGTQWSLVTLPTLVRPRVYAFFKVWGAAADDIWIVGMNGAILHWDGTAFSELGAGISQDLIGIWGTGPDDITTVGGRGTAESAHYDGSTWTKQPASPLPGLNGIWTGQAGVVHAVGVNATVLRFDPSGSSYGDPVPVPTDLDLHAIYGDPTGKLLAFGANFQFPERGVVLIRRLSDED